MMPPTDPASLGPLGRVLLDNRAGSRRCPLRQAPEVGAGWGELVNEIQLLYTPPDL